MIWNCVEDRIDDGSKYGRVSRKIIFGNIYADKTAVLSRNPISIEAHTHLKTGDIIAFYDDNEIRVANFLCCSEREKLDPKNIISDLLNREDDLKYFCKTNNLQSENLFTMVIEAYKFLMAMKYKPTNTEVPGRKRQANENQFVGSPSQPKHSRHEIPISPKPNPNHTNNTNFTSVQPTILQPATSSNQKNLLIAPKPTQPIPIQPYPTTTNATNQQQKLQQIIRAQNEQKEKQEPKNDEEEITFDAGESSDCIASGDGNGEGIVEIDSMNFGEASVKIEAPDDSESPIETIDTSPVEDFEMNLSTQAIPITISPRPILPNLGQKLPNTGNYNF